MTEQEIDRRIKALARAMAAPSRLATKAAVPAEKLRALQDLLGTEDAAKLLAEAQRTDKAAQAAGVAFKAARPALTFKAVQQERLDRALAGARAKLGDEVLITMLEALAMEGAELMEQATTKAAAPRTAYQQQLDQVAASLPAAFGRGVPQKGGRR